MSDLATTVELVVREVLAQLEAAQAPACGCSAKAPPAAKPLTAPASMAYPGNAAASPASPAPVAEMPKPAKTPAPAPALATTPAAKPANDALRLNARVVTLMQIADRMASVRRVMVPRGAIVTPAVRDELIRRGVALEFGDAANGEPASAVRLAIVAMGTDFDPSALVAGLARDGLKAESTTLDCLIESTDQLAREIAMPDTLGLLLTPHTAAGLCLANRLTGVRAIGGGDAPSVAAAAVAVGANLLVVDPRARSFFQLKQMVVELCRAGVRPCPAVFQKRLA